MLHSLEDRSLYIHPMLVGCMKIWWAVYCGGIVRMIGPAERLCRFVLLFCRSRRGCDIWEVISVSGFAG